MVVEHQFQSQATLEGVPGGQDFRRDFVEAAGLAAIAAVRGHRPQSVPRSQPGGSGGEAGQWGMGGLGALHDHFHCSGGTVQQDIQDPESRDTIDIIVFTFYFPFHLILTKMFYSSQIPGTEIIFHIFAS